MTETRYLTLKWSVSRGAETYGYNIVTLTDSETGKRYRTVGGGYDMTGTVFGDWLEAHFLDRIAKLNADDFYGIRYDSRQEPRLDGACGLDSMRRIAEAVGVQVKPVINSKGNTTGYLITDTEAGE